MTTNLTKAELVTIVAEKAKINKSQASEAIDAVFDSIQEGMIEGKKFTMTGFGTFSVAVRQSRPGRNPQTGEKIVIPGKLAARFKPGKNLKDALNSVESMNKWVNRK